MKKGKIVGKRDMLGKTTFRTGKGQKKKVFLIALMGSSEKMAAGQASYWEKVLQVHYLGGRGFLIN